MIKEKGVVSGEGLCVVNEEFIGGQVLSVYSSHLKSKRNFCRTIK